MIVLARLGSDFHTFSVLLEGLESPKCFDVSVLAEDTMALLVLGT